MGVDSVAKLLCRDQLEETTDKSPERVAVLERLTWAYLRTALYPKDPAWPTARAVFANTAGAGLG